MYRIAAAVTVLNLSFVAGLLSAGQASQNTHSAYIPANSDLGSIRLEGVKAVEVSKSTVAATNSRYCDQLAFREPGGSMFCSVGTTGPSVKAYRVSYSYVGQPLASDESGNRHFTFDVYFQQNEVPAQLREGLAFTKKNRAAMAAYFTVRTERDTQARPEVDEAHSHFCAGHYIDGSWAKNDRACQDQIAYKAGVTPSEFVVVTVDPVTTQVARGEVGGDFLNK